VSIIWRKPVLTYVVSVVSLMASVNLANEEGMKATVRGGWLSPHLSSLWYQWPTV